MSMKKALKLFFIAVSSHTVIIMKIHISAGQNDVIIIFSITSLINKHKMSSIKIDGNKLELTNISSELAENVLRQYLKDHQDKDEN